MTNLFIVLGLFVCVAWLIARTVLMIVRIDAPDDIPSKHYDPIADYVQENYGQHFQDESQAVERQLRKL